MTLVVDIVAASNIVVRVTVRPGVAFCFCIGSIQGTPVELNLECGHANILAIRSCVNAGNSIPRFRVNSAVVVQVP